MEKSKRNESVDRLSELPESLILEILSSLRMRDAVRTTLLSKRWKNLWTTVPCIDFSDEYPNFICGALALWKGAKLLKFRLTCFPNVPMTYVDPWLLFAIDKQVEELSLDFSEYRIRTWFIQCPAPQYLYSFSSITKLSLNNSVLEIEGDVLWNQLKSLTFEDQDSLSADAMDKILLGAPRLEELILGIYEISGNFNIRSPSLKMLQIGNRVDNWSYPKTVVEGVLRICAPNLLTLQISAVFYDGGSCALDVPSLTNAYLSLEHNGDVTTYFETVDQFFQSLYHVEKVTLTRWGILQILMHLKNVMYMKSKDIVVPLFNAKHLILYAKEIPDHVTMMFPQLERLILNGSYKNSKVTSGEETHFAMVNACKPWTSKMTLSSTSCLHLDHVKRIEVNWSIRDVSIIPAIEIMLGKAHILEKMVIQLSSDGANTETFILAKEKVMSMPRSSLTAQVIVTQV